MTPPLRALRRSIFSNFGVTALPRRAYRPLLCLEESAGTRTCTCRSCPCGWQAMRMRTPRRKPTQRRWSKNTGSRRGSSPRSRTRTRAVCIRVPSPSGEGATEAQILNPCKPGKPNEEISREGRGTGRVRPWCGVSIKRRVWRNRCMTCHRARP